MTSNIGRKLFLTFDVEDIINPRSIKALHLILEILEKHELHGLFFVTGHMSEKLAHYEETLKLLSNQQIGYHSSSHSVRPTILEYTDVANYNEARLESLERERSQINPLTGAIEGKGGIDNLRELFPDHNIEAFRAPDYCWSPPHLEALRDLQIKYDFSTKLWPEPTTFKGITFYPYPICHNWNGKSTYASLMKALLQKRTIVLNFHDWHFVNKLAWNLSYMKENPEKLITTESRFYEETNHMFSTFELFISMIKALERAQLLEITPKLEKGPVQPSPDKSKATKICENMIMWFKRNYHYECKYFRSHFRKFFFEV
jgi:hypothetical protein